MYVESVAVTAIGLLALTFLRRFEDKNDHVTKRRIALVVGEDATVDEKRRTSLTLDVTIPVKVTLAQLMEAIDQFPDVRRIQITQPG